MLKHYLLDTDICSYIIRGAHPEILPHLLDTNVQCSVSSITVAELFYGVQHVKSIRLQHLVETFLKKVDILDWDISMAREYATIRCLLTEAGCGIGYDDMMIAAAARAKKLILVTNNLRHFQRIPDLKLENWINP